MVNLSFLLLGYLLPMQPKGRHVNGLHGLVRRKKAFSLHCDKLARYFTVLCIYSWLPLLFVFLVDQKWLWMWHFLFQNFEKITSRVQSKNKDQVIYGVIYLFNYPDSFFYYGFCFTYLFLFLTPLFLWFGRSDIIIIVLWGVWTSCWVRNFVLMPKIPRTLMLQCCDGTWEASPSHLSLSGCFKLTKLWPEMILCHFVSSKILFYSIFMT